MAFSTRHAPVGADPYLEQYAAVKPALPGADLPWLVEQREEGRARFAALGLPTNRIEDWKYTSLRPLERLSFAPQAPEVESARLPRLLPDGAAAARVLFVNGRFRSDLSDLAGLPGGVRLRGLADALVHEPALVEEHLGRAGELDGHAMLALNTALMADGLVLSIDRNVAVERPIEIVYVTEPNGASPALYPRNLIVAGPGSQAVLIEHHVGGEGAYLVNGATEVLVGAGAVLRHYKVQEEGPEAYHIYLNRVRIGRDAVYDNFVLSIGGRLARNQIEAAIEGSGAECLLNGAYMGLGRQHLDHTSLIDHAAPNARSRQVYHGVLDGQTRGVFQGQIIVRQAAQKTDGHQLNRALLLSDGAEIDSKPNLEIYADDVKCSHGATVGDLDKNALFYLRARGIPEPQARALLIAAFLNEVIDNEPVAAAQDIFRARVAAWLERR